MVKEVTLTLFFLGVFNFLIYRFKVFQFRSFKPLVSVFLFNLKFLTGIFIWFVYTFYYPDTKNNDVHKFYRDALVLRDMAGKQPTSFLMMMVGAENDTPMQDAEAKMNNWHRNFDEAPFNENHTIIKLNALLLFVSLKTYFVHILFFCFLSLIGWILLTNAIFSFVDIRNAILTIPVMLLPSVLFWTSGVMKEPLLVLGLGLLLHGTLLLDSKLQNPNASLLSCLVSIAAGALVILFTKFFVLACFIPAVIAYLLFPRKEGQQFIWIKYGVVVVLLLAVALNMQRIMPRINLPQMLVNKQTHSIKEAEYFKAGSRVELTPIEPTPLSILKSIPIGIGNTLIRPFVSEAKNVMMLASAIENFIIISFLIMFISSTNWKKPDNLNLFLFLLTFSFAYFALVGMCTPVLGNLVRYKTPLLPLFMFAFVIKMSPRAVADNFDFLLRR
jgi:hypothetical protein